MAIPYTGLSFAANCNSRSSHGQYTRSSTEHFQYGAVTSARLLGQNYRNQKRCEHRRNDVNTVVMFFSVRTKKLPFRLLQVRWLDTAGFAGFGIHAPTMVEPKRGGSAF
jgi:hypothetical protein